MSVIFLSYSHDDSQVADQISSLLDRAGISHFRDVKDTRWGQDIENEVRIALHNCAAIIVVVSPASLDSAWVPYEIGHGKALKKQILPFLTHPRLKLPMYLSNLMHLCSVEEVDAYFRDGAFKSDTSHVGRLLQQTIESIASSHEERLTGRWTGQGHQQRGPDDNPVDFDVVLDLLATKELITGEMQLKMLLRDKLYQGVFSLTGGFVGGRFVWINYIGKHGQRPHFGTMIWDLSTVEDILVGEYVGYGAVTNRMVSGFARLNKDR